MEEEHLYSYIVFKIKGSFYCLNSRYISTIMQLPKFDKIPAAPDNVTGMFRYRDQVIQMMDLRITFGLKPMEQEVREFEHMIDARKQDHINWVNELERSIKLNEPFKLTRDPHKCALGRWYDHFTTDNTEVMYHLRKIDEPHKQLHRAADEVERCKGECDICQRGECLKNALKRTEGELMPVILRLLDETKDLFRTSVYREMALLLDGTKWCVVVDEVVGVEELTVIEQREDTRVLNRPSFIRNVLESDKRNELIFELNVQPLLASLRDIGSPVKG